MTCTCKLTSAADAFPATYDQSSCPTHGPSAPRYFVDHATIHDRVTGKHVDTDEAVMLLNMYVPIHLNTCGVEDNEYLHTAAEIP